MARNTARSGEAQQEEHQTGLNVSLRMAEVGVTTRPLVCQVLLGPSAEYYYDRLGGRPHLDTGHLHSRHLLLRTLKCRPFSWWLKPPSSSYSYHRYLERHQSAMHVPGEALASGSLRNIW